MIFSERTVKGETRRPQQCAWRQRRIILTASLGQRPRNQITAKQALKARFKAARLIINPKRTARRNRRHACAAARDTPPETCECDGALVVPRRTAARP